MPGSDKKRNSKARTSAAGKRHREKPLKMNIPRPVIRRLANHAGVFRLQLSGNPTAQENRRLNHLLAVDEHSDMHQFVNHHVKELLGHVLNVATVSVKYRNSKTIQEKDVVGAIKSLGYSFAFDHSLVVRPMRRCPVPKYKPKARQTKEEKSRCRTQKENPCRS